MFRYAYRALACLMLVGLAACVHTPPEVPFDRTAAGDIKTIGLLTPGFPDRPSSVLAASVGRSMTASLGLLGIIPALIDAEMETKREDTLVAILQGQNFVARDRFTQGLTAALQAHGFTVVPVAATTPRKDADYLASYPPKASTNVDAYLDVSVTQYGYLAAGTRDSEPYRPFLYLRVKLVRASDGSVLMQDVIAYNPLGTPPQELTIAPDPAFAFTDWDALTADHKNATAGIDAAIAKTTEAVGNLAR